MCVGKFSLLFSYMGERMYRVQYYLCDDVMIMAYKKQ